MTTRLSITWSGKELFGKIFSSNYAWFRHIKWSQRTTLFYQLTRSLHGRYYRINTDKIALTNLSAANRTLFAAMVCVLRKSRFLGISRLHLTKTTKFHFFERLNPCRHWEFANFLWFLCSFRISINSNFGWSIGAVPAIFFDHRSVGLCCRRIKRLVSGLTPQNSKKSNISVQTLNSYPIPVD